MVSIKTPTGGGSADVNELIKIITFIVLIVGTIVLVLPWFIGKVFSSARDEAQDAVGETLSAVSDSVKSVVTAPVIAAKEIVSTKEESMTIAAKRELAYAEFYGDAGVPVKTALFLGNLITPEDVLVSQAVAGADFRTQLIADGRSDEFDELNTYDRVSIAGAEAVGSLVGWSPYEAGKDFRSWLDRR